MKLHGREITMICARAEEDPVFAAWLDEQIELDEEEDPDTGWLIRVALNRLR
jgi:hypothetical protein